MRHPGVVTRLKGHQAAVPAPRSQSPKLPLTFPSINEGNSLILVTDQFPLPATLSTQCLLFLPSLPCSPSCEKDKLWMWEVRPRMPASDPLLQAGGLQPRES